MILALKEMKEEIHELMGEQEVPFSTTINAAGAEMKFSTFVTPDLGKGGKSMSVHLPMSTGGLLPLLCNSNTHSARATQGWRRHGDQQVSRVAQVSRKKYVPCVVQVQGAKAGGGTFHVGLHPARAAVTTRPQPDKGPRTDP